jgi:hypothetical protein
MVNRAAAMMPDLGFALPARSDGRCRRALYRVQGVVNRVQGTAGFLDGCRRHCPLHRTSRMHSAPHTARDEQPREETHPDHPNSAAPALPPRLWLPPVLSLENRLARPSPSGMSGRPQRSASCLPVLSVPGIPRGEIPPGRAVCRRRSDRHGRPSGAGIPGPFPRIGGCRRP